MRSSPCRQAQRSIVLPPPGLVHPCRAASEGICCELGPPVLESLAYRLLVQQPFACVHACAGHEAILAAWEEVVEPAARRFRPNIILVSAGYDAHWADPLAGEGCLPLGCPPADCAAGSRCCALPALRNTACCS